MNTKSVRSFWHIILLLSIPLVVKLMRDFDNELFFGTPLGYTMLLGVVTIVMSFITIPSDWQHGRRIIRLISLQCSVFAVLTVLLGWTNDTTLESIISPLMLGIFGAVPWGIVSIMKD